MHTIGIMQGRLTPSKGRGIQFFPFENWENEFEIAARIGLSEIEFIFDLERFDENPLWTANGLRAVRRAVERTGVRVHSICFDYFMREPFYKQSGAARQRAGERNASTLMKILDAAAEVGARLVEIPLVDASSLSGKDEKEMFKEFAAEILLSSDPSILIGLETDLNPTEFLELLESMNHQRIRANYDTGNSSGIGYRPAEELAAYGKYIENIHIKDRLLGGTTMALGTGSANFDSFFAALKQVDYRGDFILQAARGEDGREAETTVAQMAFVAKYIAQHLR